jgi:protease-4
MDRAHSPYAVTPNIPMQGAALPISMPGLERSRLPTFLYLWEPDPTLERWAGR